MTIDLSQFTQVFFEEAAEHLANMEALLLALDVDAPDSEDLNAIFRAAHSIKGGSGTFGFGDMTEVTHILETLLDRVRKAELRLTPEMVDAFLAAGDVLKAMLAHHQGGEPVDEADVQAICTRMQQLSGDPPEKSAQRVRYWLECALSPAIAGDAASVDNLLAGLAELGACEIVERPTAGVPRLALWVETAAGEAQLREVLGFYAFPEDIRIDAASAPAAAATSGDSAHQEPYGLFTEAPAEAAATADPGYGFLDTAPGTPSAETPPAEPGYGFFDAAPGSPAPAMETPAVTEGEGYGLFNAAPGAPAPETAAPAPNQPGSTSHGRRASDDPRIEVSRAGRRQTDKVVVSTAAESSSIRVSVEKVDQLINLVGELVITQAMLAQSASHLDPMQAERLLAGIDQLARNTRDLQEAVMSIRMLPMSMVFSRFPRLVRDLAGKLGKQVELRTIGEATELDKGLIEKITDPLTHLVRNSLDHGIETPEQRVSAGKSPKGALTLKAAHQGGNIIIEVIDDGAGLNREKILAKARERGLPVHDGMSDSEVWQLIYAPGFSTADHVTDVSGRGVGMDVVKKNIEGLGGRVEIESSPGFGTRTIISLPLTLAILDGMSVRVGSETYIVPLTLVVESLQPRPEDIRSIAGEGRVVHIRGEYLPLVPLAEVFDVHGAQQDPARGILMVVEAEGGRAALCVDELLGQHQVVIKSLESNYRKVPGVSGATILGDGRVALILDIAAVTRMGLAINRRQYGRLAA
ncbi:MAG: chemotaxis protein CheW [Thiobacillaceae bacterium]